MRYFLILISLFFLNLTSFAADAQQGYIPLGLKSNFYHIDKLREPSLEVLHNMLYLEENNQHPSLMKTISIFGFPCKNGDENLFYIWNENGIDNIYKSEIELFGEIKYYLMEARFLYNTFALDQEAINKNIDMDIILILINDQLEAIDWKIYRAYQGEKSVLIARNIITSQKHIIFNIADFKNAADIAYKICNLVKKEKNFDIKLNLAYSGDHIDLHSFQFKDIEALFNFYVEEFLGNDVRS